MRHIETKNIVKQFLNDGSPGSEDLLKAMRISPVGIAIDKNGNIAGFGTGEQK